MYSISWNLLQLQLTRCRICFVVFFKYYHSMLIKLKCLGCASFYKVRHIVSVFFFFFFLHNALLSKRQAAIFGGLRTCCKHSRHLAGRTRDHVRFIYEEI